MSAVGVDLVPAKHDDQALARDPVGVMAAALDHAKDWLTEAQSIEEVRHTKAIAVGYESVIREKKLAQEAGLSAMEIVRRCERRLTELVREGQRNGTVNTVGQPAKVLFTAGKDIPKVRVAEVIAPGGKVLDEHNALGDAPSERFEEAIAEARAEGNLSRANVVRKVKGETPPPPPPPREARARPSAPSLDTARGKQVASKAKERIERTVGTCNSLARAPADLRFDMAVPLATPEEAAGWNAAFRDAIKGLRQLQQLLKEASCN